MHYDKCTMDMCLIMDLGVLKCKERQVASELDLYGTNYQIIVLIHSKSMLNRTHRA